MTFNPIVDVIDVRPSGLIAQEYACLERWHDQMQEAQRKNNMRGVREAQDHMRAARCRIFQLEQRQ